MRKLASESKPQRGMLGSGGVENLRLHFDSLQLPDRPLHHGVHRVVRETNGMIGLGDAAQGALLVQFCMDRRGLWLQVASGVRGIHVNGRPVQRMALLRAGDAVYVDGVEILIRASHQDMDAVPRPEAAPADDPRVVLRGVGGKHHGRSFTLSRPCLVGSSREATIHINEPGFAERHALLERRGDRVLLRGLDQATTGTRVNGHEVRDALLAAGDQVSFDTQHRFVVEVPWLQCAADAVASPGARAAAGADGPARSGSASSAKRWPWLLLAACFLALMLAALLLFGAG